MRRLIVTAAAAVLASTGSARAADAAPAEVQDPPGSVDVNQPADVSFEERDTKADTTDTMQGASTDVIESETGDTASREGMRWREVEPGREARASFGEEQAEEADDAADTATDRMPGTAYSDDTHLGTDQGYGTGTEPAETPSR